MADAASTTIRRSPDRPDPDGHHWHSPAYVAQWIGDWEVRASSELAANHRTRVDAIVQAIPRRDTPITILDLGAGWGPVTRHLLETFRDSRVIALDFSEPMLAEARRRLTDLAGRVSLVNVDLSIAGSLGTLSAPVDAVVSLAALHHLHASRLPSLYREIRDVLAPGGVLVNVDFVRRPAWNQIPRHALGWLIGRQLRFRHDGTVRQHLKALEQAGFKANARRVARATVITGRK